MVNLLLCFLLFIKNVGSSDIDGLVDMKLIYGITVVRKKDKLGKESKVRIKATMFPTLYLFSNVLKTKLNIEQAKPLNHGSTALNRSN
jgi:hypothetical protein